MSTRWECLVSLDIRSCPAGFLAAVRGRIKCSQSGTDVAAVVLHEAAFAKDVHSRNLPGLYVAINDLPMLTSAKLIREVSAKLSRLSPTAPKERPALRLCVDRLADREVLKHDREIDVPVLRAAKSRKQVGPELLWINAELTQQRIEQARWVGR
jgi:hypothetical protein